MSSENETFKFVLTQKSQSSEQMILILEYTVGL